MRNLLSFELLFPYRYYVISLSAFKIVSLSLVFKGLIMKYLGMISLSLTCLVAAKLLESVGFCVTKFREFLVIISSSTLSCTPLSYPLSGLQ